MSVGLPKQVPWFRRDEGEVWFSYGSSARQEPGSKSPVGADLQVHETWLAADAVLEFMHEHPVAAHWGRADLASSDMMSLETTRTVWQARADPRRRTASIGTLCTASPRFNTCCNSVLNAVFVDKGIGSRHLAAVGRADNFPLVVGDDAAARAMNRRVTILVQY
jgi:hypothetical protein